MDKVLAEAVEAFAVASGHNRMRLVCADGYTPVDARDAFRALVLRSYGGPAMPPPFRPMHDVTGRIRVGLACPCLLYGGAESWQLSLMRHADPARLSFVGLAVMDGEGMAYPDVVARHRESCPVGFGRAALRALAGSCDVLVTWAVPPELLAEALAGIAPRPVVLVVSHSPGENDYAMALLSGYPPGTAFAAVSASAMVPVPPPLRPVTPIIPNCVEPSRLIPARSRQNMHIKWGVPPGATVAGYFGRVSDEKGPLAMARLAGSLPEPWHVVVIGDGGFGPDLHAAKASQGLTRFHVLRGDPAAGDVLAAFDVLVVPSRYESFGLTIAEGLWAGLPVVSTPVGVASETPGLTLTVAHDADGPSIAAAVLRARSPGDSPRSSAATAYARREWGPEKFAAAWSDFLSGLAPEHARARRRADSEILSAVASCPDRGPVLPVSEQKEGCGCNELSVCGAMKGRKPGKVTLVECALCITNQTDLNP